MNLFESLLNENRKFSKSQKKLKESTPMISREEVFAYLNDAGLEDYYENINLIVNEFDLSEKMAEKIVQAWSGKSHGYTSESRKKIEESAERDEIHIVIEDGRVRDIYAPNGLATEIIDLDADDESSDRLDRLQERSENNEIKVIYSDHYGRYEGPSGWVDESKKKVMKEDSFMDPDNITSYYSKGSPDYEENELYELDPVDSDFEKLNDDPIEIEYVEDEHDPERDFQASFWWDGQRYYLSDIVRVHNNPWFSQYDNYPAYIHGISDDYMRPFFVEIVDGGDAVNIYREKHRRTESKKKRKVKESTGKDLMGKWVTITHPNDKNKTIEVNVISVDPETDKVKVLTHWGKTVYVDKDLIEKGKVVKESKEKVKESSEGKEGGLQFYIHDKTRAQHFEVANINEMLEVLRQYYSDLKPVLDMDGRVIFGEGNGIYRIYYKYYDSNYIYDITTYVIGDPEGSWRDTPGNEPHTEFITAVKLK